MKLNFLSLHILKMIAKLVRPRYRFDWSSFDWQSDFEFNNYLASFDESDSFNTQRRWMVKQLLRLVTAVPGDTAECGVYAGAGSLLICRANQTSNTRKTHHIFDSFEGLSIPDKALDGSHWEQGDLRVALDSVKSRLQDFEVEYHKGWIPTRFGNVADRVFSFVHVDVDLFEPTRDSVEFFYPRMSKGGIILFDDYGFTTCPGATRAIDGFFADKVEKPVSLSSGGAFIIKGTFVGV
jgi:O-methyltransferase